MNVFRRAGTTTTVGSIARMVRSTTRMVRFAAAHAVAPATAMTAALGLLIAFTLPPRPLEAQTGPGLEAAGVAGAYMGLARGHQSLYWNPANLSLDDGDTWSLGLPQFMATGGMIGPPFGELSTLLDDDLTDADRTGFLDQMPEEGLGFRGNIEAPIAGVGIAGFGVALSTTAMVDAGLGRELVDLYLYTRQYGDVDYDRITEYRIGETYFTDARYSTLIAGYGRTLPLTFGLLHVGAAGRLVQGHEIQRGRLFEPVINVIDRDFAVPALAARSTGGTGFGLDVGAALQPIPGLTLGLAVQNLLQTMDWDDAIEVRGDRFSGTDLGEMSVTDIQDRIEPRPFDPDAASLHEFSVVTGLLDDAHFPRIVRLGGTFEIGSTALNGTLSTTAGDGDLHVGWRHYIALGVEQDLPVLPIFTFRAGLASSLAGASALNGGLSLNLGPVRLNAAIGRISGDDPLSDDEDLGSDFAPDDDDTGAYGFADRLAESSGYTFGLGVEIGGP